MNQSRKLDLQSLDEFAQFVPSSGKMELGWGKANESCKNDLANLEASAKGKSDNYKCCVSAAWLFQDFLDESHTVSQEIDTAEGSYLHGIMHRREGDFSNAKYWFRKAGSHDFFSIIENWVMDDSAIDRSVKQCFSRFDPHRLVDEIEAGRFPKDSLERLTFFELLAVLDYCHHQIQ